MTAPTLIRDLSAMCIDRALPTKAQNACREAAECIAAQRRTIQLQGNEIASLTSQLEAVRLAKPAHHEPPYVDGYFGER